jgi:multicomponent Na+:H+ antiporter subunit C
MAVLFEHYNYLISALLMMIGLLGIMTHNNLVKKLMGLSIFQVSVLLFYMSISWVDGGGVPIYVKGMRLYSNPVPHVLMLTAIVVGVAITAVGLAIIVRIKEAYGTIEEDEILEIDQNYNREYERQHHAKR